MNGVILSGFKALIMGDFRVNECFQFLPSFDVRFVPTFSVLFVPLVLVILFLFLAFFLYSFPPTIFFISYIIHIRAIFSSLIFLLLFPALALSLSLFIFLPYFHVLPTFYCLLVFPFFAFLCLLLFLLLAPLASSYVAISAYSALFLISQQSTGSAARVGNYAHYTKFRNNAFIKGI
jgi:hypothetical protein